MEKPYGLSNITTDVDLLSILEGCKKQERASQHKLHRHFYNYAMNIARRYTGSTDRAEEVVNDAFFKVFTKIQLYNDDYPFQAWLRRIIINVSIDRYRSHIKDAAQVEFQPWHEPETEMTIETDMTKEQVFGLLDQLPPAYRAAFNLFVVDGFSHEEIAEMLEISEGASKSNLSRARQHLRRILSKEIYFQGKR